MPCLAAIDTLSLDNRALGATAQHCEGAGTIAEAFQLVNPAEHTAGHVYVVQKPVRCAKEAAWGRKSDSQRARMEESGAM